MKKSIIIIFSLCIFLLCISCNELDLFPLSEASKETWFTNEDELESSVAGMFENGIWNNYASYRFYEATDDYSRRAMSMGVFSDGTLTGETWDIRNAWNTSYKCIARANFILENIDKVEDNIPEVTLNRARANARFVRATQYAKLIFHFGDVPYYKKTLDIEEAFSMGRKDKFEILDEIFNDYDYAIQNLPEKYGSSSVQYATKGAALAMKARIALYMGDYTIARDAAKACIDLGVYELFSDYRTLFLSKTKNSVETIFAVAFSEEQGIIRQQGSVRDVITRTAGGYCSRNPSWELFCSYLCTDGLPIDESPLFNPQEPFKNRDPRCTATIVEFGREWLGFTYTPHPDSITVLNHNTGSYVTNNDCRANTPFASFNGLAWAKEVDEDWIDTYADNDNIIMRFADVLLMYAEAKIELGEIDNSVLNAMNMVRSRAYGVDYTQTSSYPEITSISQSDLRQILRVERRMEFAKESTIRYNDIIRWKLAEKVLNLPNYGLIEVEKLREKIVNQGLWFFPETPPIDEDGVADFQPMYDKGLVRKLVTRKFDPTKHYLWPIPSSEMEINENMTQNPNY